jgi:2-polyprenyl-6-methoxyphenol hydroxylase-like FAD-dependent oxidoreductase
MASDPLRINGMAERVAVVGAGIAGLGTAMALARAGREIVLIDRDPPPPESVETAFDAWQRKGVTQLRHSHAFLGQLYTLIRDRHPRLMQMLLAAGVREITFEMILPLALQPTYRSAPGDADLRFLMSRRTTLEHVMRAYVRTLPGVSLVTEALVRGLEVDRSATIPVVKGVRVERNGAQAIQGADIVVDASGRNSILIDVLRQAGCVIPEEESPIGILYYTRHYRLRDGQGEPPRDGTPGAGDLGYIKYGVFGGDNRNFSITLSVPEIELALRTAVVRPEVFEKICASLPGCARWTDSKRSAPVTKVFAMGNLRNVWREFAPDGKPQVLNFFAVGDAAVRTNPLYGRGCASAVAHAHALAEVLDTAGDPAERAALFAKLTRRELRAHWESIKAQDLGAIRRARHEQNPHYKPRLKARLVKSLAEEAIGPATRGDVAVLRAFMRGFHMLEPPARWLKRPEILARVLWTWAKPRAWKLGLYPPKLGPERKQMLTQLGLEPA